MAEYIELEKLNQYLHETMSAQTATAGMAYVKDLWDKVLSFPAADVAPVVRCRECKHFNLQTHECENELLSTDHEGGASYSLNFYDDDFCSYGEKKNE